MGDEMCHIVVFGAIPETFCAQNWVERSTWCPDTTNFPREAVPVMQSPSLYPSHPSAMRRTPLLTTAATHHPVGVCFFQAIAEFPQLLCQGLGRAARVAFLLLPADSSGPAAAPAAVAPSASASDGGDAAGAAGAVATAAGTRTRTMSTATACREVCRRVADFESDHPSYPAFLDSLLLAARCQPVGGARVAGAAAGGRVVRDRQEISPNSSAPVVAVERGMLRGGVALRRADVGNLAGNERQVDQRQPNHRHAGPRAATATAINTQTDVRNRDTSMDAPIPQVATNGQRQQQPLYGAPLASPVPPSAPVEDVRIAVAGEKALGAAMTAAAKGPGGGRDAAAMLVLEGVDAQRDAAGR